MTREEIERHCVSTLLLSSQDVFAALMAGLQAEYFTGVIARETFRQAVAAAQSEPDRMPFEVIYGTALLGGSLKCSDLTEISLLESTSTYREKYVNGVITEHRRAQLLSSLTHARENALAAKSTDWDSIWQTVAPHINAIGDLTQDKRSISFVEHCDAYTDQQLHPERVKRIPLGIPAWDRAATQVASHEMVTLAGRPGTGKTALALQLTHHVAIKHDGNTAFFSLEMKGTELVDRLAKHDGGMDCVGEHADEVKKRLSVVAKLRQKKTLFVYDEPNVTMDDIEARCRLLAAAPGGLSLVVIDYLQLITPGQETRRAPREQQVAEISRRIKLLPKRIGAPVLLLAQLNRESEKENRPPRKSDLRESGAIEQDSDRVWFLYQPILKPNEIPPNESANEIDVCLLQDKCRGGPPGVVLTMRFNRPCYTFRPIARGL